MDGVGLVDPVVVRGRVTLRGLARSIVAVLAVVITSCGSQAGEVTESPTRPDASSSVTSTSARAATPRTSAAPNSIMTISSKELAGTVHALGTVFTPCSRSDRKFQAPRVLDPSRGRFVKPPAPTGTPPGTELLTAVCTLAGTTDDLKVLYVWRFKTPAAGLSPETFTTMAAVTGINDTAAVRPVDLTAEIPYLGDGADLVPTTGASVLDLGYGCDPCTMAISADGPKILWTAKEEYGSHDDVSVAFENDDAVTIRDVATGQDAVVDGTRLGGMNAHSYNLESGYLLVEQGGLGDWIFGYYSTVAKQRFSNVWVGDTPIITINDGRALLTQKHGLKLINMSTGAIEFELSADEMKTLDSYQFAAFGKYLYVVNQNDSPVLDITNRQRVSSGWKVRPSEWISPSWLLIDHRETFAQKCYEGFDSYGCTGIGGTPEELTLTRIEDGNYTGPFF